MRGRILETFNLEKRLTAVEDAVEQPTDKMFKQIQEQNRRLLHLENLLLNLSLEIRKELDISYED